MAEPVLAAPPRAAAPRRAPALPAPEVVDASPSPAEYFAVQEDRAKQAHASFDPQRAVKGPTVVVAKRRRSRAPLVLLGVVALAGGAALGVLTFLGGDDAAEPAARGPEAASAVAASAEPEPTPSDPGAYGTIGDLTVQVVSVADPFRYSLSGAPDGSRYVKVEVELANDGDGLIDADPAEALGLVDGDGRRWPLAEAPYAGLGEALPVLGPGMRVRSSPVFAVSDDAVALSLAVTVPGESGQLLLPLG